MHYGKPNNTIASRSGSVNLLAAALLDENAVLERFAGLWKNVIIGLNTKRKLHYEQRLRRFVLMRGIFQLPVALCSDFYYEKPSVSNNYISKRIRKDKDLN